MLTGVRLYLSWKNYLAIILILGILEKSFLSYALLFKKIGTL